MTPEQADPSEGEPASPAPAVAPWQRAGIAAPLVRALYSNTFWGIVIGVMLINSAVWTGISIATARPSPAKRFVATGALAPAVAGASATPATVSVSAAVNPAANATPAAVASTAPARDANVSPPATAAAGLAATRVPPLPIEAVLYSVAPGDSLTRLAEQFGVAEPLLATANGLAPTAQLRVGQRLAIPPPALLPGK